MSNSMRRDGMEVQTMVRWGGLFPGAASGAE